MHQHEPDLAAQWLQRTRKTWVSGLKTATRPWPVSDAYFVQVFAGIAQQEIGYWQQGRGAAICEAPFPSRNV